MRKHRSTLHSETFTWGWAGEDRLRLGLSGLLWDCILCFNKCCLMAGYSFRFQTFSDKAKQTKIYAVAMLATT